MMTVTHGKPHTRKQILFYAAILAVLAVGPAFTSIGGWVYLAVALYFNARFLLGAWRLSLRSETVAEADKYKAEKKYFGFSILYLFVMFGALAVDAVIMSLGLLPALPVLF